MDRTLKVLSIDGGGIRGIIPALVLSEIERRTGKRIATMFDLIAGTSTGGIIALGVAKPNEQGEPEYEADEIVDLYETKGGRIFAHSLGHNFRTAWGLLDEKFPSDQVEEVFEEYFGDARLQDALTNLLVTAYEIEQRSPWFFRSSRAKADPAEYDFPMKSVARATSAAPTYFEPLQLQDAAGRKWALVDGGVYANNPTMCAIVEARELFGADQMLVVSLGTGEPTVGLDYDDAKDWGLIGWARPVLDVVFEGVSGTVAFQAEKLAPVVGGTRRYYRFQVPLPEITSSTDDIDDARESNLRALREVTERMLEEREADLDELCGALVESKVGSGFSLTSE